MTNKNKNINQKQANATEVQNNDIRFIMSTEQGRRFIYEMLSDTHQYQTSFTGNSHTFFREGERNIGVKLMKRIHENCLDEYVLMLKEARKRAEQI